MIASGGKKLAKANLPNALQSPRPGSEQVVMPFQKVRNCFKMMGYRLMGCENDDNRLDGFDGRLYSGDANT